MTFRSPAFLQRSRRVGVPLSHLNIRAWLVIGWGARKFV